MTDESDFNLLQEGEFQSKYEPKEILGRSVGQYNKLCTCSNKTNNYIAVGGCPVLLENVFQESQDWNSLLK